MEVLPSLRGQCLMAMPSLLDPNFHRTVTCLSEHNERGAMGLVINRPHAVLTAADIFKELSVPTRVDAESIPIYLGGPVHADEIFILHGEPFGWQGCHRITDSMAMSNSLDLLHAIANGGGSSPFLITLGCAGWAPGQLEAEIAENTWLTGIVDETILFAEPAESKWDRAMKAIGVNPLGLSRNAGHA